MKKNLLSIFLFSLLPCLSFSQSFSIRGNVTDKTDKSPLPGVSIIVKGTTIGTISDMDGNFTLSVNQGNTLVFSFIGYNKQEITITNAAALNIILEPENVDIDEVVVIGYGTVKKSDLTGSVSTVSSSNIKQSKSSGIDQAMQGRAAGVTVTANSGQPGKGVTVRVRGIGTVNNSDPLYVVDGVSLSEISFLNPGDIQSMEILKDASATAIYGSRGANGVVLITTNKGSSKSTKMNTSFDFYVGVQNKWKTLDLMNREQYARFKGYDPNDASYSGFSDWVYRKFGLSNNPYIPTDVKYEDYDTDWQNVVFRDNARISNYHFSVDGGSKEGSYAFSFGYFDQDGIIIASNFKRLTLRVNTTYKLSDHIKIGENLSLTNARNRGVATNNENYSVLNSAISFAPWDPVKYPDGRITPSTTTNLINPISMIENQNPKDQWNRLVGNVYMDITPLEGLTFKSDLGSDVSYGEAMNFKPKYNISPSDYMANNFLEHSYQKYFMWLWENTLTYHKLFEEHDLTLLAGMTAQEGSWDYLGASKTNLPNESPNMWYLDAATQNATAGGRGWEWAMQSYLGRIQYAYKSRYLLTFSVRRDGSSRLGENNKWGIFPSTALKWKISEEGFFEPLKPYLNTFNLKAGWGQTGNQEIGNYAFTTTINSGTSFVGYVFGQTQTLTAGAAPLRNANPDLSWEAAEQTNFGADFSMLESKVSVTMEYYIKNTLDMLVEVPVPGHVGVRYASMQNAGKVQNKGFEFSAEYKQNHKDFYYTVGGNFSITKNEVISLGGGENIYSAPFKGEFLTRTREGDPIGAFYGYQIAGIFQDEYDVEEYVNSEGKQIQPNAQPGDYKFVNQNDDNKIDQNDKVNLGNPFPDLTYGLNASLQYKGFDFQIFIQGVQGNELYNCNKYFTQGDGYTNLGSEMENAWHGKGTSNSLANPAGSANNLLASSRYIEDGSYLRLKNLQIGYSLPKSWTSKAGLTKMYFYLNATNLLTFTKYSGFDPEIGVTNGLDMGVDRGTYPQARIISIGATINL